MFKVILASTITLVSASSFALDKLMCSFTEPFISVHFDANTKAVTEFDVMDYNDATGISTGTVLSEKAEIRLVDPNQAGAYSLVDMASGNVILTFELSGSGTDGMSDQLYPFSAIYKNIYGGCSTETAATIDTEEVMQQLGSSYY